MSYIIAVDFDGTLCYGDHWPKIGKPRMEIIHYILKQKREGAKIILWTNRCGENLKQAIDWCKQFNLVFDAVNDNVPETLEWFTDAVSSRKIFAHEYIDDRNRNPDDILVCYTDNITHEFSWPSYGKYKIQASGDNWFLINGEIYYKKEDI